MKLKQHHQNEQFIQHHQNEQFIVCPETSAEQALLANLLFEGGQVAISKASCVPASHLPPLDRTPSKDVLA